MNETRIVDPGPRIPRQVAAQHAEALALLEAQSEPPPSETPAPSAAPAAPATYTPEQLLTAPDAAKDNDVNYWRARANVIVGLRRQDFAKATERENELLAKIAALEAKYEELRKSTPAAPPAIDLSQHFKPEILEQIGEENARAIVETQQKIAASLVEERVAAAVKPFLEKEKEKQQLDDAQKKRAFYDGLTQAVPNWLEINKDPRWLGPFLSQVDDLTGKTRQEILNAAEKARNLPVVVQMLTDFISTLPPAAAVPAQPPATAPTVPGDATGGTREVRPGGSDGKWMTEAEIKEGYLRKNGIKRPFMTPEEARQFDARVAAQMASKGRP